MSLRERVDDWMNPIAVKELRQAVRGKFVMVTIILSLLGELIAVAAITISGTLNQGAAVGPMAFTALFGVVFTAALFLVPIYSGFRIAAERAEMNVDLLFVTTIRPRTIVFGKVISAATLVILLFSASLPFLVFSYVLRGVDFVSIAGLVAFSVLVVVSHTILGLFIGCLPTSKPFKLLLGVAFFISTFFIYAPMLEVTSRLFRFGLGVVVAGSSTWKMMSTFVVAIVLVDMILIVLTTAMITPAAANRALPIRTMIVVAAAVSYLAAVWVLAVTRDVDPLQIWSIAMLCVNTLVLLSATSERETWGPRVARTIPENPVRRVIAYFFYSGAAGGTLWAIAMNGLVVIGYVVATMIFKQNQLSKWPYLLDAGLAMTGFAMTSVLLRRTWLRRVPARRTWGIALALFFLLTILPPMAMVARDAETNNWTMWVHYTTLVNPFPMPQRTPDLGLERTIILAVWALAMLLANAPWFVAQARRFQRYPTEAPPSALLGAAVES